MGSELHRERRERLAKLLGPGTALILSSPPERTRNGDVTFKFRQDSDILYLTGFEEPGTMVLLRPDHPQTPFVMFVRPRNPTDEIWTGRRAGVEGAVKTFGADIAYPIDDADARLPELISGVAEVHYHFGRDPELDERVLRLMSRLRAAERRGRRAPVRLVDAAAVGARDAALQVARRAGRAAPRG
jgi:Xaa-Pro aminopeptidase